jgi:hypothetical protein
MISKKSPEDIGIERGVLPGAFVHSTRDDRKRLSPLRSRGLTF